MLKFLEEFEPPEGVRTEFLRGEIWMTPNAGLVHNLIVTEVQDQIPRERWRRLQNQYVDMIPAGGLVVPDLVVTERGSGPDHGVMPAGAVSMLLEVVSGSSAHRDYRVKRSIYAAAKLPAYLITDPVMAQCVLLTEPVGTGEDADYRRQRITKFGDLTRLEPIGIELDTSEFATYEKVRPHRYP
ncbi:Uma2 family endonuclease [Streptomyces sp. NPDC002676]